MLNRDDEVVTLGRQRHKVQIQRPSRGQNAHSTVHRPAGNLGGHGQVREFLALIALNAAGIDPAPAQFEIEQRPGSRPALAIDECHVLAHEIVQTGDLFRIAFGHDQPLGAPDKPEHHHPDAMRGQGLANGGDVVVAIFLVQQMRTGEMRLPALQGEQPAQRANMGRRQAHRRVALAQRIGEQIEGHVVAANRHDGVAHPGDLGAQLDPDHLALVMTLLETRDAQHAIALDQRGNHTCAPGKGRGDQAFAHLAHRDPHKLIIAGGRDALAGEDRVDQHRLGWAQRLPGSQQRHAEKLEGDDGRDRISRNAGHRPPGLAGCGAGHAQHHRVAGPNRHAMDLELAQVLKNTRSEILAPGG